MFDVSIINCCFMQEQWLDKVYWSLRNQRFSGSIEIILSHDHCDTGQPTGKGPAWARNEAAKKANGKWLLFNDGDNFLPSNYVQSLWDQLDAWDGQWPDVEREQLIVGCPAQFISGRELARIANQLPGAYGLKGQVEKFTSSIDISITSLVAKEAWEDAGGFEDDYAPAEDLQFWIKLLSKGYKYIHTWETALLKNNETGITLRTPFSERDAMFQRLNSEYGLSLKTWEIIG